MVRIWHFLAVLMLLFGLSACALTDPWRQAEYNHLKPLNLDEQAASIAGRLRQTHVHAKHKDKNALAAQWTPPQMIERAEALAIRGVPLSVVHNDQYDHLTSQPELLNKFFDGRPDFREYIAYSKLAVMARSLERPDQSGIFDLEVMHRFKGLDPPQKIAVTNFDQEHFGVIKHAQAHKVSDGQVCLFFLSQAYTDYRRANPLNTELHDPSIIMESYPRFCEQKNGRYSYTQSAKGEPLLFRDDILTLSPPIERHTQRPTHLPRTNNIAMRGEWDILIIDDDRFAEPYGTLSVTQNIIDLTMPCRPNIYGGHHIVNGQLMSDYGGRHIQDQLKKYGKGCLNTPGHNLAKSLFAGTFYGDRETIWFDGPYMSFIAKRAERVSSKYGWNKYLTAEFCLLDHPKVGAEEYAGFGHIGSFPNHWFGFALVGDGVDYWEDCKPDDSTGVRTVSYSLTFLEAKLQDIKTDIISYDSQFILQSGINQQTNSILINMDPNWAKDNQDIIKRLTDKHPYIEWREELPFDEILTSGG